jgi:DNA-binding response OmpR family regulator/anti-sigma regulatory factor (Ser/Thr protein kinase)
VVEFVKSIVDSYVEAHPERHFVFTAPDVPFTTEWDAVKMESVLNNLLSNACKYTADDATIGCSVTAADSSIEIKVSDDGFGIPKDEQALVFQRMYRSSRTADMKAGTGIGLYLVRQYVEMHGGTVSVESRENIGTTFTVMLPLAIGQAHAEAVSSPASSSGRAKILIVEDNLSIADFIKDILSPSYDCQIASNGRAALALLSTFRPNLIITDEMMPVMTGLEMCRRIKAMPAFASVPIFMITAKDDNDTETGAVKLGIDNFLTKPFEAPLLLALVARKIQSREEIKTSLRLESITDAAPIVAESQSEKQLDAVTRAIEKYIDDSELNVNFLCEKTGYSSKQLYRLIKKFVGVTPVEYIRQIRLKKAAMLLENHDFTVSEVMYMVGFSSPSYFSKCFAAQYGCTPSKYKGE